VIGEPVQLTIRRRFERPTPALVDAFRRIPISMVADAQDGRGGLPHAIKPLAPGTTMIGPAVTARCHTGDNLAALAAFEVAQPGDVVVIATEGNRELLGVVGDRYAAIAANLGLAGIVVDGLVRDPAGIREAGVPCYCRGVTANSVHPTGPGEVGLDVVVGEAIISPGDLVLGDDDGVLIVKRDALQRVAAALAAVKEAEQRLEAEIRAGLKRFPSIRPILSSPRTRYLDE